MCRHRHMRATCLIRRPPILSRITTHERVSLNPRTWKGGAALLCALAMAGCGGSGSGSSSAGTLRFVNATQDYGAVDLYLNDVEQLAGVGESSASSYLSFDAATYTAKLKHAGSTVTSATQSVNMAADGVYTLVA